jgi:hypothetical protein
VGGADSNSESRIFVSYTASDEYAVRRVVAELEKSGLDVWFAPHELSAGERLSSIHDHIEQARLAIVMISRAALNSPWVQHEINAVIAAQLSGQPLRIIPVLLESVRLPISLADTLYVDLSMGITEERVRDLVAALKGERSSAADTHTRFSAYVDRLIAIDSDSFASIDVASQYSGLSRDPDTVKREIGERARRNIEDQLTTAGVSVHDRRTILAAFEQGRALPIIKADELPDVRSWLRRFGTDELIDLAAELWRGVVEGWRGVTVMWLAEDFLADRIEKTPADPTWPEWRAEALSSEAKQAGLLARSTEQHHPKTYASQDAQVNPGFDMGPMVWVVGRLAADFQESETSQSAV